MENVKCSTEFDQFRNVYGFNFTFSRNTFIFDEEKSFHAFQYSYKLQTYVNELPTSAATFLSPQHHVPFSYLINA